MIKPVPLFRAQPHVQAGHGIFSMHSSPYSSMASIRGRIEAKVVITMPLSRLLPFGGRLNRASAGFAVTKP